MGIRLNNPELLKDYSEGVTERMKHAVYWMTVSDVGMAGRKSRRRQSPGIVQGERKGTEGVEGASRKYLLAVF